MPALNWAIFKGLPGSAEKNFELLCRGIVRQNFGSFGVFRALANQPGVEFHLKLDKRHDALGDPDRWWGWQCKWYELAANGILGTTRRDDIEDGIRKAETHVPGLTDWVLWTCRTLTKADQEWFYGLSTKLKLHLWTADEVDNYLTGPAAILRSTYFGELVLTPESLRECHSRAIAPVRARWQPDVHHVGESERDLRRMLGETTSWEVLRTLSANLRRDAQALQSAPSVPPPLAQSVTDIVAASRHSADMLDRIRTGIESGDLDRLRDEFRARPRRLPASVATAPRKLRSGNHRAGLYATNAVASCHDVVRVLEDVESAYASRLVAVLAPAGCGKTHLAAQLTSATATRPHGVLLHGRDLHATHTLDDLARHVAISAQPVPSMEALLAAVDSAGQRAHHRLPVFIDGLNESEDPRTWKPLLSALEVTLAKYPYVLLVCTLRPDFVNDALPDGTRCFTVEDYGDESIAAVREHFRYWKIDATDVSLPGFLRHPLTLRLFCEVTNPTRQQTVGVNAMPGSLTALFERYLDQVATRVVELAPRAHRFYAHDVTAGIATIANKLWESRDRSIHITELRSLLGDAQRPWDQSLVRALEHEGVLLRMPTNGSDSFVPVYDLLGGHIIANVLLAKYGQSAFETWLNEPSTTDLLTGDYSVRHPLAEDVLRSLVGQVPRRFHAKQLWQLVDEPVRGRALRLAARLEPKYLDAITVEALLDLVREADDDLVVRMWEVRGAEGHPLNAIALDRVLRTLSVADRDLRWTEWLRRNNDGIVTQRRSVLEDLEHLEKRWRTEHRRAGDRLRARWVMWTTTSTVRRVRDLATRALYWFGRVDAEGLFALTIDSLNVNDAYVSERMLAASYGVVMSHQHADTDFGIALTPFLEQLASALVGPLASAPTHHYLARLYAKGIFTFAGKFYATTLPGALRGAWAFATPTRIKSLSKGDPGADEAERTLQMDFRNYTLGRLFADRRNYDMNHAGHQAAVAHVRGVVWALGWRAASFEAVDCWIAADGHRRGRGDRPPAERYGKKYGWIGFYTYAGILEECGQFPRDNHRFSDVDIDPSFPDKPRTDGVASVPEVWLVPTVGLQEDWVRRSKTSVPLSIIRRATIGGDQGPWIAVHGHISTGDRVLGRYAWAYISALVVSKESASRLMAALKAGVRPWGTRDVPIDHYVFAGEIPWNPEYASVALSEGAYHERVRIGAGAVDVELLAHEYAWESYHSDMNRAGAARVPSRLFSAHFDLRSAAQSFDQFLPDGKRATITLGGADGLDADIVYVREDLLLQYVGRRTVVWFAFGERELRPYPPSPPAWLVDAQDKQENSWIEVLTGADLKQSVKRPKVKKQRTRQSATTRTSMKRSAKKIQKRVAFKSPKDARIKARQRRSAKVSRRHHE